MEKKIHFKNRSFLREWLTLNNSQEESIWIIFFKDGTESVSYDEALEESLCFGWIDSLIKRIDDRTYMQKFSKRRKNSKWSARNKEKVARLIKENLMTESGLKAISIAKESGEWDKSSDREELRKTLEDTAGFRKVIKNDPSIVKIYDGLSDSLKKHYALYYFDAKKEETRKLRLEKIIDYMRTKKRIM